MSIFGSKKPTTEQRLAALEAARDVAASECEYLRRKVDVLESRVRELESDAKAARSRIGQIEDETQGILFPKVDA